MQHSPEKIHFRLIIASDAAASWYDGLKIVYVLHGKGKFILHETEVSWKIGQDDIFAINILESHSIIMEAGAKALSLFIPQGLLIELCADIAMPVFELKSFLSSPKKQTAFDPVRSAFALAFRAQYKKESIHEIHLKSRIIALLDIMVEQYLGEAKKPAGTAGKNRLYHAVTYMHSDYHLPLTLGDVAAKIYITSTYLSRLFTKHLGQTFSHYLMTIRIAKANDLMRGNKTLTEIAYEVGFATTNAMINAYKTQYQKTPGQYRVLLEKAAKTHDSMDSQDSIFSSLLRYAKQAVRDEAGKDGSAAIHEQVLRIDAKSSKTTLSHHWKRLVNAGYAKELLEAETQRQFEAFQSAIGFTYGRVKGVLDDDMCLYTEDANGNPVYSFVYLDEVIDYLLALQLKPHIVLSHLPSALAKKRIPFFKKTSIVSMPNSLQKWEALIDTFITHLKSRYHGLIYTWLFSPYMSMSMAAVGRFNEDEYWETYSLTFRILRSHGLQIASSMEEISATEKLDRYLSRCVAFGCIPDILSLSSHHAVDKMHEDITFLVSPDDPHPMFFSEREDFLAHYYGVVRALLAKHGLKDIPVQLEEMSNTLWQRDLCNDSCFKSTYLMKNILDTYDQFWGYGNWAVFDRMEELPPSEQEFSGGIGLFTRGGIPKACHHTYVLLGKMGDQLLTKGEGYFVTCSDDQIQIYLYNYTHYDELYRTRHATNMTSTSRYNVFNHKTKVRYRIRVAGLATGMHAIERWSISPEGGSAFDEWVKIGAPEPLGRETIEYIKAVSKPVWRTEKVISDGLLEIESTLCPHEIQLITVQA